MDQLFCMSICIYILQLSPIPHKSINTNGELLINRWMNETLPSTEFKRWHFIYNHVRIFSFDERCLYALLTIKLYCAPIYYSRTYFVILLWLTPDIFICHRESTQVLNGLILVVASLISVSPCAKFSTIVYPTCYKQQLPTMCPGLFYFFVQCQMFLCWRKMLQLSHNAITL